MALTNAVLDQNIELIKSLLDNPRISVNYTDSNHNYSALHRSILLKNVEITRLLLQSKRCDVKIRSFEGYTPLHLCCKTKNTPLEIVEMLLEYDSSSVDIYNNEEVSPLQEATINRRFDILKTLVKYGANVNHLDLDGETCLHYAAGIADYEIIEFLLNETDIDSTIKNRNMLNALCVLITRAVPEPDNRELIFRSCCILIERCYKKDELTDDYDMTEIFQPTILGSVYNAELSQYFICRFYSHNNPKYYLIEKLDRTLGDSLLPEYKCYLYSFIHDKINRSLLNVYIGLDDINIDRFEKSIRYFLMIAIDSNEANEVIIELLEYLVSIGFNPQNETTLPIYLAFFLGDLSDKLVSMEACKRLFNLLQFFTDKEFDMNFILSYFLRTTLFRKPIDYCWRIVYLLLPFVTKFFIDSQYISFKFINNKECTEFVNQLIQYYGDFENSPPTEFTKTLHSLQHLCRNKIRKILLKDSTNNQEFFGKLNELTLTIPKNLIYYLKFDETPKIF